MKTIHAKRWLGLAAGLWAGVALAEDVSFPVLTILNRSFTSAEIGLSPAATECRELDPLTKCIVGPLFAAYGEREGLAVTEDELKKYCRRQLPDEALFTETWAEWQPHGSQWKARQEAILRLTVWKLQKSLFQRYGGRVLRSNRAPPQAFDAMLAYVSEREAAGDFEIHDARLKLRFWECLRMPTGPLVPEPEGRAFLENIP